MIVDSRCDDQIAFSKFPLKRTKSLGIKQSSIPMASQLVAVNRTDNNIPSIMKYTLLSALLLYFPGFYYTLGHLHCPMGKPQPGCFLQCFFTPFPPLLFLAGREGCDGPLFEPCTYVSVSGGRKEGCATLPPMGSAAKGEYAKGANGVLWANVGG